MPGATRMLDLSSEAVAASSCPSALGEDGDSYGEAPGSSSFSRGECVVCGDQSTGRHYGSPSCNGCKGFFRRTIRRSYTYTCRFNGNCKIDKHNRAVCRACRYQRCINFGMKVEAVQNERDLIGKRPKTSCNGPGTPGLLPPMSQAPPPQSNLPHHHLPVPGTSAYHLPTTSAAAPASSDPLMDSTWDSPPNLLEFLLKAENKVKSLRDTVIKETGHFEYAAKSEPREQMHDSRSATVNDIFHSLHSQLLLVIEWAKSLRPFGDLSSTDQMALLKNFASQHIVLCVAYRSINSFDSLKLLNDSLITRPNGEVANFPDDYYRRDCERVMDQLVAPMRFMQMDDYEFIAMKACVLFNPVAKGLSHESVMKVLQTRRKIFASLEYYVNSKSLKDPNRVGDLTFFILSPLQSLAKSLSEDVLMTRISGAARLDHLMEELILEDGEPKKGEPEVVPGPRPISFTERKLSDPNRLDPSQSLGTANAGNYDYDLLSTLSNYMLGPYAQGPLSPLNDPYLKSFVEKATTTTTTTTAAGAATGTTAAAHSQPSSDSSSSTSPENRYPSPEGTATAPTVTAVTRNATPFRGTPQAPVWPVYGTTHATRPF